MIWLSITENIWTLPKLKISNNNFNLDDGNEYYAVYYKRTIYIPNAGDYIDCFYHEWRHFYQREKDIFQSNLDDEYALVNRFQNAMNNAHEKNNKKFEKKLFRLYLQKVPAEEDAYSYQFLKCPNGILTKYHKRLLN